MIITPTKLIDSLKNSDDYIKHIYTEGSCYKFYKFLRELFEVAEPYINKEKNHVITKIDSEFYDINGKVKDYLNYFPMEVNDVVVADKWSFRKNNLLKLHECPNCDEPLCFNINKL